MPLLEDYQRGIIRKSTYIRMCITSPRHQLGDSYEIQLPIQGVNEAEVFSEAAALVLNEFVSVSLSSFTVTWLQPELLPSYSAEAVRGMKVAGQGYLYFALGADNLNKTATQLVEPGRLTGFYGMTNAEILAELGRLTSTKTCTSNISKLSVQWLNRSAPAAREFDSVTAAVAQLRKEISEAVGKIPAPTQDAPINHTHSLEQIEQLATELNALADEINSRQLKGNYATTQALADAVVLLQTAMGGLQADINHLSDRLFALEAKAPTAQIPIPIVEFTQSQGETLSPDKPTWVTNTPLNKEFSLDFGSESGNYWLRIPVPQTLREIGEISICGWVYRTSDQFGSGGNRILTWLHNGDGADLSISPGGLQLGVTEFPDNAPLSGEAIEQESWVFFGVSYSAINGLKYFKGNQASTATVTSSHPGYKGKLLGSGGSDTLTIGNFNPELLADNPNLVDRSFRGLLYAIRIFDKALTLEQFGAYQYK